ncbi:MAG TPA: type II toxin-antitoxin system HicA family toxin [Fimbriimonadaceae bacterium]|nr:type II toxin-antitoxin system HicA family toxin [Fimbriimonadaceae bacterium]
MPRFGPISRRDLISTMRILGFDGPLAGGNHEYMVRDNRRVFIPNPHGGEISVSLLARVLRQAGITRSEWEDA